MNSVNDTLANYIQGTTDKPILLATMQGQFGLRYEIMEATAGVNATGSKPYYSLYTHAADFGYAPHLTSLEGILIEAKALLQGMGA